MPDDPNPVVEETGKKVSGGSTPATNRFIFLNSDGTISTSPTGTCPLTIQVWANEFKQTTGTSCNPTFDYAPMIKKAKSCLNKLIKL